MELYAAGFNCLQQLQRRNSEDDVETPSILTSFTRMVPAIAPSSEGKQIKVLATLWSASVLFVGDHLELYGFVDGLPSDNNCHQIHCDKYVEASDISYFFGDEAGVFGAMHKHLGLLSLKVVAGKELWLGQPRHVLGSHEWDPALVKEVAVRGDDTVCTYSEDSQRCCWLQIFSSLAALTEETSESERVELEQGLRSLQGSATAFAALQLDGQVLTFGSALQPALLARTQSPHKSAGTLLPIPFFDGIPVEKIVTCGWLGAALSKHRDLYIWGGRIGESQLISALPDSGEEVRLVDIADGVDIIDVAVGMNHILTLTVSGDLWGCGDNEHGQLGLGDAGEVFIKDWKWLTNDKAMGGKIESVKAGGWGSWLAVQPSG